MINYITPFIDKATPYINIIAPQMNQIISKIGLIQIAQIAFVYNLFDSAIANILALETNRHGTDIYSYAKIHLQGAKTCKGGHVKDSYQSHSKNRVFVFKDNKNLDDSISTTICAFGYSLGAYLSYAPDFLNSARAGVLQLLPIIPSCLAALVTPTVKFRHTPEQLKKDFKIDDEGGALFTEKNISPLHLGISGSLIQGLNFSLFNRISNHPTKFILGVVQLTAAVGLTCIFCGVVTSSPVINSAITVGSAFMNNHWIISNIALGVLHITTF